MQGTEATFEVFPYDRKRPALTIRARGHISFNSLAYEELGEPRAVLLLVDVANGRLAVKRAEPGDRRAFPVKKPRGNNAYVSATSFLEHYGLAVKQTTRYEGEMSDDMLIADVR